MSSSYRWPNLFSSPDQARDLVNHPAWALLVSDLKTLQDNLWAELAAERSSTPESVGITKGLTRAINIVLDLPRQLSDWQEREKQRGVAVQERGAGGY